MTTYQWVSPTGHLDPSLTWNNPNRAYDGNWNTYADNFIYTTVEDSSAWTEFLTLTLPGNMWIDKIRFKYWRPWPSPPAIPKKIDIDVYNVETGTWQHVINGFYTYDIQHTIFLPCVHTDRVRVRIEDWSGLSSRLYELDVEQVIPDSNIIPPNPPEVYQKEEKKTTGQPTLSTTRIRTIHRCTTITPWVV